MRNRSASVIILGMALLWQVLVAPLSVRALDSEDVVARFGEEEVKFESLLPPPSARERKRGELSTQAYTDWLLRYAASSLRLLALRRFRSQLVAERSLTPTTEQVEEFILALSQADAKEFAEVESELAREEKRLETLPKESKEYREVLTAIGELRSRKALLDSNREFNQSYPELRADLNQRIATRSLTRWLTDRELYLLHGGRVAFRYAGPEPIDAYLRWLKEKEAKGEFSITSGILTQEFWSYFQREARAVLLSKEDAKEIYKNPNWAIAPTMPARLDGARSGEQTVDGEAVAEAPAGD